MRVGHLLDVVEGVHLGGEAAVHAQELLVHEGGQGEAVERLHARVVHALRVLDLACTREKGTNQSESPQPTTQREGGDRHTPLNVDFQARFPIHGELRSMRPPYLMNNKGFLHRT